MSCHVFSDVNEVQRIPSKGVSGGEKFIHMVTLLFIWSLRMCRCYLPRTGRTLWVCSTCCWRSSCGPPEAPAWAGRLSVCYPAQSWNETFRFFRSVLSMLLECSTRCKSTIQFVKLMKCWCASWQQPAGKMYTEFWLTFPVCISSRAAPGSHSCSSCPSPSGCRCGSAAPAARSGQSQCLCLKMENNIKQIS